MLLRHCQRAPLAHEMMRRHMAAAAVAAIRCPFAARMPMRRWNTTQAAAVVPPAPAPSSSSLISPDDIPRVNLVKLIARAGVASRRGALQLIQSGRVTVDGRPLGPADNFQVPTTARIAIDGRPFLQATEAEEAQPAASSAAAPSTLHVPSRLPTTRLFLYYKPAGVLVSHRDERFGRTTVYDKIRQDHFSGQPSERGGAAATTFVPGESKMPHMLSVGRLDYLSEGLLLLTNDGGVQQFLEHPSADLTRTYRIRVARPLADDQLAQLRAGLNVDGFQFKPVEIVPLSTSISGSTWYEVRVQEGKNRELRTLMNHFDRDISKLVRVTYAEWSLFGSAPADGSNASASASVSRSAGGPSLSTTSFDLQPGEFREVEWPPRMERKRREWLRQYELGRKEKTVARLAGGASTSAPSGGGPSAIQRPAPLGEARRTMHTSASARRLANSSVPIADSSSGGEPAETTMEQAPAPKTKKQKRIYPESTGFYIVPDKSDKADKARATSAPDVAADANDTTAPTKSDPASRRGGGRKSDFKAALQRGAPPPRKLLAKPSCLEGVDRPWMQDQLTLKFEEGPHAASAVGPPMFELRVRQWTGMHFPVEGEAEQPDAGSGAILWDAALHLVHYLHSIKHYRPHPDHAGGAILELGAGTGVLGLGVEKIAAMHATGTQVPVVLTDEGPVLDLLRQNIALNGSSAIVLPFRWSSLSEFLPRLDAALERSTNAKEVAASSASASVSFVSTILASELLDTIPGPANGDKGILSGSSGGTKAGADGGTTMAGLAELVSALDGLAKHSLQRQQAADIEQPRVEVYFTFEQRGVLHMRDGPPIGLLQEHLLRPLRECGFDVHTVHAPPAYEEGGDLVLLHLTMHSAGQRA